MKISTEIRDEVIVVHVEGKLDAITSVEFEKEVICLINKSARNILIDFEKLDYISSAGFRSMLLIVREQKKFGGSISACSINELILEVFHLCGMDLIISIYAGVEEYFGQCEF